MNIVFARVGCTDGCSLVHERGERDVPSIVDITKTMIVGHAHPKVAEAAVVGAADETTGQGIVAFVILRGENNLDADTIGAELRNHVGQEIGPIAKPRQIMIVQLRILDKMGEIKLDPDYVQTIHKAYAEKVDESPIIQSASPDVNYEFKMMVLHNLERFFDDIERHVKDNPA